MWCIERSARKKFLVNHCAEAYTDLSISLAGRELMVKVGVGLVTAGTVLAAAVGGAIYSHHAGKKPDSSTLHRVLFYRDPMHPSYTSPHPGKAPDCGMPLEPV